MNTTPQNPSTKDTALRALGVVSTKDRKVLASQVEYVQVRAGRTLLARGSFAPTALIGVTGTVLVTGDDDDVVELTAPYVIDTWAADERRVSNVTVVAEGPSALLLVDWQNQEQVNARLPVLARLSADTHTELETRRQDVDVVDVTETSESPVVTDTERQSDVALVN